jgi:flagellum-specific ATP synthase
MIDISKYLSILGNSCLAKRYGKVTKVVGLVINGVGVSTRIGDLCEIYSSHPNNGESKEIKAQVVGFADGEILLMPLGDIHGIRPLDRIITTDMPLSVWTGHQLLGRAVDALGKPIDDVPEDLASPMQRYPVYSIPPQPFKRKRIGEPLATGVRAIDGLLTCGKGQRVGIFSGSGIGKSILMGMIARNTNADVNVIALIGERGREVQDFIEKNLGTEGLARSVVVVATSDQPPLIRSIGASAAMAIAEYFRDQGKAVLFMMDSITRYAMAEREIGLATGEPPTTKGYTPSVFAKLPKLLERAGTTLDGGTITGLYTVLVEADDMTDPIGDSMRALLDGHIVLSRDLAERNHYPAIEITQSLSRLMVDIVGTKHREAAGFFRETLARYNDSKDLIDIGAYTPGNNPRIDYAVKHIDAINNYLKQSIEERADFEDSISRLVNLLPNSNVGL